MKVEEITGHRIIVEMHGDEQYYRAVTIDTDRRPEEIEALFVYAGAVADYNMVKSIKFVRSELNCGLREAKYFCQDARQWCRKSKVTVNVDTVDPDPFR